MGREPSMPFGPGVYLPQKKANYRDSCIETGVASGSIADVVEVGNLAGLRKPRLAYQGLFHSLAWCAQVFRTPQSDRTRVVRSSGRGMSSNGLSPCATDQSSRMASSPSAGRPYLARLSLMVQNCSSVLRLHGSVAGLPPGASRSATPSATGFVLGRGE